MVQRTIRNVNRIYDEIFPWRGDERAFPSCAFIMKRKRRIKESHTHMKAMSNEEIARATLGFIDEYGLDAVSFRKIGQETGMPAMTICNRFGSKENLLKAALKAMLGENTPSIHEGETWDEGMRRVAHHVRNMSLAHPKAYWLFLQVPPFESPVKEYTQSVFLTHTNQNIPEGVPYDFLSIMHSFLTGFQVAEGYINAAKATQADEHSDDLKAYSRMFGEDAFNRNLDIIIRGLAKTYGLPLG